MGVHQVLGRDALEQLELDRQGRLAGRQARAVAQAKQMGVYRHGGLAESHIEHHIGGFSTHTGQRLQRFAGARHRAAMLLHQDVAGLQQVARFAAVQAYGFDLRLQARQTQLDDFLRRVGHRKQAARGFVHAHVGGLG